MAALALWIERLPASCHLLNTTVTADGRPCRLTYVGPPAADGVSQINAVLPENLRTGLVMVEAAHDGAPLCSAGWVRIVPPGPSVPRITGISDGVNLLSGNRIVSGNVKVTMEEVAHGADFHASVDSLATPAADAFCTDPVAQRWEFNFNLPENLAPGPHRVSIAFGPPRLSADTHRGGLIAPLPRRGRVAIAVAALSWSVAPPPGPPVARRRDRASLRNRRRRR